MYFVMAPFDSVPSVHVSYFYPSHGFAILIILPNRYLLKPNDRRCLEFRVHIYLLLSVVMRATILFFALIFGVPSFHSLYVNVFSYLSFYTMIF